MKNSKSTRWVQVLPVGVVREACVMAARFARSFRFMLAMVVVASLLAATIPGHVMAQERPPDTNTARPPDGPGDRTITVGIGLIFGSVLVALAGGAIAISATGIGFGGGTGSEPQEYLGYGLAIGGAALHLTGIALIIVGCVQNTRRNDEDQATLIPTAAMLDDGTGVVLGASGRF
jgi:hypothetical protein